MENKYKISSLVFLFSFFSMYIVFFLLGYTVFYWKPISLIAVLFFSLFIISLLLGAFFGERIKFNVSYKKINLPSFFIVLSWLFLSLCVVLSFLFMINKYNSINYIVTHAFVIREQVIGGDTFIPFYLSYINSLNHAFFVFCLVTSKDNKNKYFTFLFFINIVMCDLLTFGRVGTLYAIFILISYLFFNKGFKLFNLKLFIYSVFLFFILNLSRIIRGGDGGFSSSVVGLIRYLRYDLPEWSYGLLSNYTYFFSSPIAFSEFLNFSETFKSEVGQRLFTPIYNIVLRLLGESRINTIDPFVNIPYSTNIYTILRDIYADLGVFGVAPYGVIFGFIFGMLYNAKNPFYASVFFMLSACVFFFPLYNALSFGMFLISILFLLFLAMFFKVKF